MDKNSQISATQKNLISVLMGIYNCAGTLEEAVACIREQTYPNWELFLCDDGSTDDTFDVAKRLADEDKRIQVLRHDRNLGLSAALNTCLAEATGEFIARMDGDDLCTSDRFEKQLAFLHDNPDYDIVSSAMDCFDENGIWGTVRNPAKPTKREVVQSSPICHAPAMMTANALRAVGGYTVGKCVLRVEDVDLWIKLYAAGYRCANLQEPLYLMRNDQKAVRRRKYAYRINETIVRFRGATKLQLGGIDHLMALRPLLVGLIPGRLRQFYRKKTLLRTTNDRSVSL